MRGIRRYRYYMRNRFISRATLGYINSNKKARGGDFPRTFYSAVGQRGHS